MVNSPSIQYVNLLPRMQRPSSLLARHPLGAQSWLEGRSCIAVLQRIGWLFTIDDVAAKAPLEGIRLRLLYYHLWSQIQWISPLVGVAYTFTGQG